MVVLCGDHVHVANLERITIFISTFDFHLVYTFHRLDIMPLPRPARVLRQIHTLPSTKLSHSSCISRARLSTNTPHLNPAHTQISLPPRNVHGDLDSIARRSSDAGEIDDPSSSVPPKIPYGLAIPEDLEEQGPEEEEDVVRVERRSPAALIGSKRLGLVILPEELSDGINQAIRR